MSLDFRLFFGWHASMMVMVVASVAIDAKNQLLIAAILGTLLVTAAIRRRQEKKWHWRGADYKQWLMTIGQAVFMGYFGFVVISGFSAAYRILVPTILIIGGMCLFNSLAILRLAYMSEEDFLDDCGPATSETVRSMIPTEPTWNRAVRGAFMVGFMACWLAGVTSIYIYGKAEKSGSSLPTVERTERLEEHGRIFYVSTGEKHLFDELRGAESLGIPVVLVAGLLIHFVLGVQLFPDASTNFKNVREFFQRK